MRPVVGLTYSAVALLVVALVAFGCDRSPPEPPSDEFPPDPDLPPAVVDLPTPPPESAFEIHEFNEDGSLRVEGLIGNREKYLTDDVEVLGYVHRIVGADCDPAEGYCPSPHLFIRDHLDEDLEMMVVGYRNEFLDVADLEEGEQFLFAGNYDNSWGGFVSSEIGLLVVDFVDDHEVTDEYRQRRR